MIRGTALVSAICLLAIILLLIGGKPLIALLFGKAFRGAYTPARHSDGHSFPRRLELPVGPDALRARQSRTRR